MPLLKLQTNIAVPDARRQELLAVLSRTTTGVLGKPERYVMVVLEPSTPMCFAGSEAPCAYLELKSIGLPEDRTAVISATLTDLVNNELGIARDRVYIEFAGAAAHMWGWNGGTF